LNFIGIVVDVVVAAAAAAKVSDSARCPEYSVTYGFR
jgi:hypothetical protein